MWLVRRQLARGSQSQDLLNYTCVCTTNIQQIWFINYVINLIMLEESGSLMSQVYVYIVNSYYLLIIQWFYKNRKIIDALV